MYTSSEEIGYQLAGLGITAATSIVLIIVALVGFVLTLALHYVEAIPVYKLAKKNGISYAWVALIPIKLCSTYVLAAIPGEREVSFFGKWKLKSMTAIFIYLGVVLLGVPVMMGISSVIGGILGLIPFIGVILAALVGTVLGLIPGVVIVALEYYFLRDVIDLYNADKKSNSTTSLIVTIINYFVYIARGIYLWTLLKKEPLTQNIEAEYSEV